MTRRTALVTGASSGIGFEMARLLAAEGYNIVAVARRRQRLDALVDALNEDRVWARVIEKDLSQPQAANELWADLARSQIAVDVLVNNAGTGVYGALADQDESAVTRMLELNVVALTTLTRLALPAMLAQRWGRILNVASVAGYQPGGPRMSAYYASKSYVLSFSKGLAGELRGTGVSVTALCPGPTHSGFEETSRAAGTRLYRWTPKSSAESVARAGYRATMRGSSVSLPGLTAKVFAVAGELPPRSLALAINRFLLREP